MRFLFCFCLICILSACQKDSSLRSERYDLIDKHSTGLIGTLAFIERKDSSNKTTVELTMEHTVINAIYDTHLHDGSPTRYHQVRYDFGPRQAMGNMLRFNTSIPINYDSAVRFNGTFIVHDYTGDTVLALCGVGSNK